MGFTARHPRYTIALVVLLFVTVLLFINSDPSSNRPYPLSFHEHPGYVDEQIKISEAYYQESLKERQNLIAKWGPSPSQVDPFPSKGEFYTLCEWQWEPLSLPGWLKYLCRGLLYTSLSMPASNAAHWHPG